MVGGSQVVNAETGEVLQGVNEASWRIKAVEGKKLPIATVTIELHDIEVEIRGNGLVNLRNAIAEETARKKAESEQDTPGEAVEKESDTQDTPSDSPVEGVAAAGLDEVNPEAESPSA